MRRWHPDRVLSPVRAGEGDLHILNDGAVVLDGPFAEVVIADASGSPFGADPTSGPLSVQSNLEIGASGLLRLTGSQAHMLIGTGGPSADGVLAVSGPGAQALLQSAEGTIVVGNQGRGFAGAEFGGLIDSAHISVARKMGSTGFLGAKDSGVINASEQLVAGADLSLVDFSVQGLGGFATVRSFDGGAILFDSLFTTATADVLFGGTSGPAAQGVIAVANEVLTLGAVSGEKQFSSAGETQDGPLAKQDEESDPEPSARELPLGGNAEDVEPIEPKPGMCV